MSLQVYDELMIDAVAEQKMKSYELALAAATTSGVDLQRDKKENIAHHADMFKERMRGVATARGALPKSVCVATITNLTPPDTLPAPRQPPPPWGAWWLSRALCAGIPRPGCPGSEIAEHSSDFDDL